VLLRAIRYATERKRIEEELRLANEELCREIEERRAAEMAVEAAARAGPPSATETSASLSKGVPFTSARFLAREFPGPGWMSFTRNAGACATPLVATSTDMKVTATNNLTSKGRIATPPRQLACCATHPAVACTPPRKHAEPDRAHYSAGESRLELRQWIAPTVPMATDG
jgi:hypothetical protein